MSERRHGGVATLLEAVRGFGVTVLAFALTFAGTVLFVYRLATNEAPEESPMRTELWLILAFSAVAAAGLLFMALRHLQSRSVAPSRPIDVRLQEALDEVKSSMGHASELMAELQREMDAQTAARDALVAQAEENRRLAEIDREQAERIRGILFAETKAEARRQKRAQWAFFLAGVLISIPIGIAINLLTN